MNYIDENWDKICWTFLLELLLYTSNEKQIHSSHQKHRT
jgi:hypothetical protein